MALPSEKQQNRVISGTTINRGGDFSSRIWVISSQLHHLHPAPPSIFTYQLSHLKWIHSSKTYLQNPNLLLLNPISKVLSIMTVSPSKVALYWSRRILSRIMLFAFGFYWIQETCRNPQINGSINNEVDLNEQSKEKLLSLVAERLFDSNNNVNNKDAGYVENQQQNIVDVIDLLPRLTTGIDSIGMKSRIPVLLEWNYEFQFCWNHIS
ncbi:hypothetical protein Lser_V15G36718 [Lactuca serriola]